MWYYVVNIGGMNMIFKCEHRINQCEEFKMIPKYYPVAASIPKKSQFYNKQLSNSFGNRFSHEKYVLKKNEASVLCNNQESSASEVVGETEKHVLVKKKNRFRK